MCAFEPVKKIIDDTSSLVSYVRNSGLGNKCQPQLEKYVVTRWIIYDTNFTKLAQILLEKEEADRNADVMCKLTNIHRADLEIIAKFLKKFKDWTKQLEYEKKPTLWMVWPIFINLNKYLVEKDNDDDLIKSMKAIGRDYIEKNKSDFEPQMVHKISTVLHPLLKNIAITTAENRDRIYDVINDNIQKYNTNTMTNALQETTVQGSANQDILDEFMGSISVQVSSVNLDNRIEELQRYLDAKLHPIDPFEFNLLGWWSGNRNSYPNLFRYFVSLAGITAASSPSDRRFSETGIILTAQRASLLPDSDLILARNVFLEFL